MFLTNAVKILIRNRQIPEGMQILSPFSFLVSILIYINLYSFFENKKRESSNFIQEKNNTLNLTQVDEEICIIWVIRIETDLESSRLGSELNRISRRITLKAMMRDTN